MSTRILLLLAGLATLAVAFSSERLDTPLVSSELANVPYKYGCKTGDIPVYSVIDATRDGQLSCAKYRVSSVWNDIIFLIDSSSSYGDFAQLYYTMSQIIEPFSITRTGSTNIAMVRAGISFFNSKVTVVGQFGQTLQSDIPFINTLPYYNATDKVSNIDLALQIAENQFTKSDRPIARKVIVLMTATANYTSNYADKLKSKGFIINVYNLQNPDAPSTSNTVQLLASPSYATDSITNTVEDLQALQARANCFCDPKRDTFTFDNVTGVPTGGCYGFASNPVTPASYSSAVSYCSSSFHGIVALDKSQQKTLFLNKENNGTSPYYIGLKWSDDYLVWVWEDGTMLSEGDFNLFPNGRIPSATGDNKCVYQDINNNQWTVTACRNSLRYLCEFAPCDSTNYYCSSSQ